MAFVCNNQLTKGIRGKLGNLVFKKYGNRTIVAMAPQVNKNRIPTAAQRVVQERFKRCNHYAISAMADPELNRVYTASATRVRGVYQLAFADAWHPPEMISLITDRYRGAKGDEIIIGATDKFGVSAVRIAIYSRDNELIEEGDAVADHSSLTWRYTVAKRNTDMSGTRIVAKAFDRPGNEGVMEVTM